MWSETVRIHRICWLKLCTFAEYVEWNCVYLLSMLRKILRICRVCWVKLCIFTEYAEWNSAYSLSMQKEIVPLIAYVEWGKYRNRLHSARMSGGRPRPFAKYIEWAANSITQRLDNKIVIILRLDKSQDKGDCLVKTVQTEKTYSISHLTLSLTAPCAPL
jgi:hypothetical protein